MGKRSPFSRRQYIHLIKVTRSPFRREQILEGVLAISVKLWIRSCRRLCWLRRCLRPWRGCVGACTYMHTRNALLYEADVDNGRQRQRQGQWQLPRIVRHADYRSKAPYESKNYRRRATHSFFLSLSLFLPLLFLRKTGKNAAPSFSNLRKILHFCDDTVGWYFTTRFIFRICFTMKKHVTSRSFLSYYNFPSSLRRREKVSGLSSNEI